MPALAMKVPLVTAARRALPFGSLAAAVLLASCGPSLTKADNCETSADNLSAAKSYPAAAGAMERSLKYDSNEPRRWLKLARLQRLLDEPAQAALSYQHALDLDPANIEALQNLAILLVRAGRYDEAHIYVDPLLLLSPNDIAGTLALGAIALYGKKYDEAEKVSNQLIDLAPASIGGYSLKAHVLEATGRAPEAAHILQQRFDLDTDDVDLGLQLLELYRKTGNIGGIQSTSIELARLVPNDPRYQLESARALHAKGREADAQRVLAALKSRYAGNPSIMTAIADYWRSTLPPAAALEKVVAMTDAAGGRVKAALADTIAAMGAVPTVLRLLAPYAAQPVDSGNVDIHASYATALLAAGRQAEARAQAAAILAFDESNDKALLVRARDAFLRRDYAHALTDAQLVASDDPTSEAAALLIPTIYSAMGSQALAAKAYGDGQQALPNSIALHRARIAWMIANGHADDAVQIAAVYARGHAFSGEARAVYRSACAASKDPHCKAGLNIGMPATS